MMRALLLTAWVAAQGSPSFPVDVSSLVISPPTFVCELDLRVLKGEVRRVSWSPDSRSLHVQTIDVGVAQHDYIVTVLDGVVSEAFGEPEWAAGYWAMKSGLAAPGLPSLRIDVQQDNRRTRPTPFGSNAVGGAYTPDVRNPVDAFESEVTLRLLGLEIGSWLNDPPMAGETYGWGPAGSAAIVYVGRGDRLMLMDQDRHRRVAAVVKGATMPAWSSDGGRLAFLQKNGKARYRLMTLTVGRATI